MQRAVGNLDVVGDGDSHLLGTIVQDYFGMYIPVLFLCYVFHVCVVMCYVLYRTI